MSEQSRQEPSQVMNATHHADNSKPNILEENSEKNESMPHIEPNDDVEESKEYACTKCPKVYKSRDALRLHDVGKHDAQRKDSGRPLISGAVLSGAERM